MAATLTLVVVTPQRQVLEAPAHWVEIPADSGQMRALPGHAPTLGALGAGVVRFEAPEDGVQAHELVVCGGFLEVLGDRVTLLADLAELPKEINHTAARTALEALQHAHAQVRDAEAAHLHQREIQLQQARLAITR